MAELKVKVTPDLSDLKGGLFGAVGGDTAPEQKKQSGLLGDISAGVFIGNAALKGISLILEAFDPILSTISNLLKVLVLVIFLPLLPLLREFLVGFAEVVSILAGERGLSPEERAEAREERAFDAIELIRQGELLEGLFLGLGNGISLILDGFKSLELILNAAFGLWDSFVIQPLTAVGEFLFELISGVLSFLGEQLENAWNLLLDAIDFGRIFLFGEDGSGGLWGEIGKALASVNEVIFGEAGLWAQIEAGLSNVLEVIFGENGLWNQIASMLESAKNTIEGIFNSIVNVLNGFLNSIRGIINLFGGGGGGGGEGGAPDFAEAAARRIAIAAEGVFGAVGGALGFNDFIMRPGQAPVAFSPGDTVIGAKDFGALGGGGVNFSPTYRISADVDADKLKRVLQEHDREFLNKLRQFGTFGGRTFNV